MMDLENQPSHYTASVQTLAELFDPKSLRPIRALGGWTQLLFTLNSDGDYHEGLPSHNLDEDERVRAYGSNTIPRKVPVTFFELCKDALSDPTVIILSVFAVISLILGLYETFYSPPDLDEEGRPLPKVDWVEGCAILLAVVIIVLVTAVNDYNKEKQFMKLNAKKEDRQVIVIRDGEKTYIPIGELLVGDVLFLETGEILPADAILLHGECEADESSVTGESRTIVKHPVETAISDFDFDGSDDIGDKGVLDPMLISGSKIVSGQGRALVICVGVNSMWGRTMMSLDIEEKPTPLQVKLEKLTNGISKYAFVAAALLLIILLIEFASDYYRGEFDGFTTAKILSKVMNIFITSITIVVVALPEGLPLAVTLALAFATTRMAQDGNLVRVLKSCETMGSATTVCSDKTGTLTINKMKVVEYLIGDERHLASEVNEQSILKNQKWIHSLKENILLNSTAFQNKYFDKEQHHNNPNDEIQIRSNEKKSLVSWVKNQLGIQQSYVPLLPTSSSSRESDDVQRHLIPSSSTLEGHPRPHDSTDRFIGSKTECALLSFVYDKFHRGDGDVKNLQKYRDENESRYAQVIPFESSLKWSGLAVKNESGSFNLYLKGAAEIVLSKCQFFKLPSGEVKSIDDKLRKKILRSIQDTAGRALRAISIASYELDQVNWNKLTPEEFSKFPFVLELTVGIQDPLRPGVKEAIENCHRAGVVVKMVTGDSLLTARAISLNCGILNEETYHDESCYIEGPAFRKLPSQERAKVVKKLHVMARSSPEDKRILVETLKSLGEVVAVTGDGTNDAPALKLADVGFSMGISGTEVAREASDIVLMTDDFSSIVDAIKWGRTIGNSIKKFVQFQLTVNVTAVVLTFWTSVASKENNSVLTAVQLLWVNLIMDTLAALALATDKPDDDVLDSKPNGRNDTMIDVNMWKMILGMSFVQLVITLQLYYHGGDLFFGVPLHEMTGFQRKTIAAMNFNTFVWMQVFTLFVSRKLNECSNVRSVMSRITRANIGFFQGLDRNAYFIMIVAMIAIGQLTIMEFGGYAFSVTPQTSKMWLGSISGGIMMIPAGAFFRIIPNHWITEYLPLNTILKIVGFIEWVLLGFGFWDMVYEKIFGPENDSDDEEEDANDGEEGNQSNQHFSVPNNISANNNRLPSEDYFMETPESAESSKRRETHNLSHLNV